MFQIWFAPVQVANGYASKQQFMACSNLDKYFLLPFSKKHRWIICKSKSKTPSTLGQKVGQSTETQCDTGLLNQPSDPKGLSKSFTDYRKLCTCRTTM